MIIYIYTYIQCNKMNCQRTRIYVITVSISEYGNKLIALLIGD